MIYTFPRTHPMIRKWNKDPLLLKKSSHRGCHPRSHRMRVPFVCRPHSSSRPILLVEDARTSRAPEGETVHPFTTEHVLPKRWCFRTKEGARWFGMTCRLMEATKILRNHSAHLVLSNRIQRTVGFGGTRQEYSRMIYCKGFKSQILIWPPNGVSQ